MNGASNYHCPVADAQGSQRLCCGAHDIIQPPRLFACCFLALVFVTCEAKDSLAQPIQVMSPKELEHVEGDTLIDTNVGTYRWQQVFSAADFELLPDSHQVIAFLSMRRPDSSVEDPFSETWEHLQVRLSITDAEPGNISSNFNDNLVEAITVYEGLLTLESTAMEPEDGPRGFSQIFELQNPFVYDPDEGNLLLEMIAPFGIVPDGLALIDAFTAPTSAVYAYDLEAEDGFFFGGVPTLFVFVPEGDFSHDGFLDASDVNLLSAEIVAATRRREYDLTNDDIVNKSDLDRWVRQLKGTWFGDADLDGEFNSSDLVAVFQAGKYNRRALWSEGDWNADLRFDSGDLVAAFQDEGYDMGPRVEMNAVPEPTSFLMLMPALIVIVSVSRSRGRPV